MKLSSLASLHFVVGALLVAGVSYGSPYADQVRAKLSDPLLHQGLVNRANYEMLNMLSQNYPRQNTLNIGWLSVFRRYNSGETLQNRTALNTQISAKNLIFDMDGSRPLDWMKVYINRKNEANFSEGQYVLSLGTANIENRNSPVLLVLLSNQHVVNDFLSNPVSEVLSEMGYTVAVLEYPNYGASLGRASLQSWLSATRGASVFLNKLTGKKIYLLGHSIGGPLAIQAAAAPGMENVIQGAISYGGFSDLIEMSKDQQSNAFITFLAKPIAYLTLGDNVINGVASLKFLAEKMIPTLVMHGKLDGAVPVRHLTIFDKEMQRIRRSSRSSVVPLMMAVQFDNLYHEEVNNYTEVQSDDFFQVWDVINTFIRRTSPFMAQSRP